MVHAFTDKACKPYLMALLFQIIYRLSHERVVDPGAVEQQQQAAKRGAGR